MQDKINGFASPNANQNIKPNVNHFRQLIRHAYESVNVVLRIIRANCFTNRFAIFLIRNDNPFIQQFNSTVQGELLNKTAKIAIIWHMTHFLSSVVIKTVISLKKCDEQLMHTNC